MPPSKRSLFAGRNPARQTVFIGSALLAGGLVSACFEAPDGRPPVVGLAGTVQLAAAEAPQEARLGGGSPYGDYLAGLVAGKEKDITAAAHLMQRVLESDPENKVLRRHVFQLVAADGRHAEAVRLARQVVEDAPDHVLANLVLAVDSVERGAIEDAIAALGRLPERGLSSVLRPMVGSWLQLRQTSIDTAVETLAPIGERQGFEPLHQLQLALLEDVAGRTAEAETAYRKALETSSQPALRLTWLAGNFFRRQGKAEDARAVYQAYRSVEPQSALFESAMAGAVPEPLVPNHKAGIAEALFNLTSLLGREEDQQLALAQIHLALRLHPRFDLARLLLGESLESQGRTERAIEVYRAVDPASPLSWTARLRIAEGLEEIGRSGDAIAELEGLGRERPERFEPLFRVGNILRSQDEFEKAVDAYDRAFARLGENPTLHWSMLYFRGIALERAGEWERAEKDLQAALKLEPDQPYVMNYLAYSWVEQKTHLDEAKAMLVRAVELRPNDGYIVDSLGWVYYRLGDYEDAVVNLERAVELRPQDPVINDHLGDAYWRVGRHAEARFQWRRALSLEPEADQVPTIEAKIEGGLKAGAQKI